MDKETLELFKIPKKIKAEFIMYLKDPNFNPALSKYKKENKAIDKYVSTNGNTTLSVNPSAFVVIKMIEDEKEGFSQNPNNSFVLNKKDLALFTIKYENYLKMYKEEVNEIYIKDNQGKLSIDKEKAKKVFMATSCGDRTIKIVPSLIEFEETEKQLYASCLMINSLSNFTLLSYEEMEYLLYELKKININELIAPLLTLYIQTRNIPPRVIGDFNSKFEF